MIHPWKVLNSKISYQDRWIKVRSDSCQTLSGKVIEPYHVLEYPDWVNVVALTQQQEIVLVRQYRHGSQKIMTELPSGAIEKNDLSPEAAARRELLEETGFSGDRFFEIGSYSPNPANHSNTCYAFLALDVYSVQEQMPDPTEDLEVIRLPFKEFLRGTWSGEIPVQAPHAATFHLMTGFLLQTDQMDLQPIKKVLVDDLWK